MEDLGYSEAVSAATAALAAINRVAVGIGVAPAPLLNPALAVLTAECQASSQIRAAVTLPVTRSSHH